MIGTGICIIIIMQEKDSFSFRYALVPVIFNNFIMIVSQCFIATPLYVNTRMVAFGAMWYIISIIAFFASYHKLLDFFYVFDDLFMFSTGLSLFYSWQTYEKNDCTFTKFFFEQSTIFIKLQSFIESKES